MWNNPEKYACHVNKFAKKASPMAALKPNGMLFDTFPLNQLFSKESMILIVLSVYKVLHISDRKLSHYDVQSYLILNICLEIIVNSVHRKI